MNHIPLKGKVLKDLHEVATHLQALLRGRPALTDAEQLFVENRLMMMQIEYQQWAKLKIKDKAIGDRNSDESVLGNQGPKSRK